jgi:hypothetical protein
MAWGTGNMNYREYVDGRDWMLALTICGLAKIHEFANFHPRIYSESIKLP